MIHVCGHKVHQNLRKQILEKMLHSHLKINFVNTYVSKWQSNVEFQETFYTACYWKSSPGNNAALLLSVQGWGHVITTIIPPVNVGMAVALGIVVMHLWALKYWRILYITTTTTTTTTTTWLYSPCRTLASFRTIFQSSLLCARIL